ncbi:MAG: hypothetical protein J3R72DRAFT_215812 [Linnemannia gamsii]|nr:MAG: hypothetical protein J3R72DRAFT_215812 [Linnemannia gamsii]
MAMPASQSHIDPHALDSLLHQTLQLHHLFPRNPTNNNSMAALVPSALDQQQKGDSNNPLLTPARSPSRINRRRAHSAAVKDLSLNGFFSSSSSSFSSSDQVEEGMESPLTASSMMTSPTQSSASRLPSFESGSSQPLAASAQLCLAPSFLSPPTSPISTISPTSPLKIAFSCPRNHRNDPNNNATTFASFHNQLSPGSKQSYITQQQQRQRRQQEGHLESEELDSQHHSEDRERSTLFRSRSHSQPATIAAPSDTSRFSIQSRPQFTEPPQLLHQSRYGSSTPPPPPPPPRRMRVSTTSSSHTYSTYSHYTPPRQHHLYSTPLEGGVSSINHRVSHQIHTSSNYHPRTHHTPDSKKEPSTLISIHVRYVPKDLWVQVDLPRDMPVHKARDLILSKCRLTSIPPQTSSTAISTVSAGSKNTDQRSDTTVLRTRDLSHQGLSLNSQWLTRESASSTLTLHSDGVSSPYSRSQHRPSRSGGQDDDSFNDQESIDDDEAEMRAEELMGSDMFGQSPPARISPSASSSVLGDSFMQGRQGISRVPSRIRHNSQGSHISDRFSAQTPLSPRLNIEQQEHTLSPQQLNRLISYSSLHKSDGHGSAVNGDRHIKDGQSTKRFSNIPGWSHYRSRQSSNNSKHIDREVLDHGGMLADHCVDEDGPTVTEARKSECTAWKACFGLFWLAAGHWLDDSRLVSSYNLQPHCLLELQLRNNYIQLPPPGTPLNYYDHYAEGLLYKRSKKNKLGQGNKECIGVWKERWVVLQGNKLSVYHKRKDTTKKSIELTPPLIVIATAVPQNNRHSFKLTSSSTIMSSNMITVSSSQDPTIPQVCFRASSETELNHWIRILNSLNNTPHQGLPPPVDPHVMAPTIAVPPPLPPLPSVPPPSSMDRRNMSISRRQRHHSHTATCFQTIVEGAYYSERKRSHTSQVASATPSINPVLISNAAAAMSNIHQISGGSISNNNSNDIDSIPELQANYTIAELKYRHSRSSYSSNGSSSYKNLHQLERQTLSRNSSLSSYRNSIQSRSSGLVRQRTVTEPGPLSRIRSMNSQRSSLQMLRDQLRRSNGATPEPLAGNLGLAEQALKNIDAASPLEPSVQALLKVTGTALYSGYIWLYIPHDGSPSKKDDQESLDSPQDSRRALLAPSMSRTSSASSVPTTQGSARAANICITKASGRYVKCFAVINDQGEFQWTEVKKPDDSDEQCQSESQIDSLVDHRRFGFPLTSTCARREGTLTTGSTPDVDCSVDSLSTVTDNNNPDRKVQASMAHKLRLYFFCIKISTTCTGDIIVEYMESPSAAVSRSTPPGSPPARSKKSPLREQNRLSGQPRMRTASSPLPPQSGESSRTKGHTRSGSMVPSFGRFVDLNPPVWPSMSPYHERALPPTPLPTPPLQEMLEIPKKTPTSNTAARGSLTKSLLARTPSLFVENRSRSAPPGSIFPTAASLSRHSSYSGLLRNVILAASADITPEQILPKYHSYSQAGTPDGTMMMLTPESTPPSNVLSLAEDLHKALQQTRQESSDNNNMGEGSRDSLDFLGSPLLSSSFLSPMRQTNTSAATKPTLSEITSKKRASFQQQQESLNTALNVERSRLKLIGVLNTLEEGCEIEESAMVIQEDQSKEEASRTSVAAAAAVANAKAAAMLRVLQQCPFLEKSEATTDAEGRMFVSLKGYTETEAGWRELQKSLEHFLAGPIKDQRSALPPEDTLIPSYHAPRAPEIRLSEKAQNFLKAKDRAAAAAAAAAAQTATALMVVATAEVESTVPAPLSVSITVDPSSSTATKSISTTMNNLPPLFSRRDGSTRRGRRITREGFHRHSIALVNSGTGWDS